MAKKTKRKQEETIELTERQKHIAELREKLNAPDPDDPHPFTKYKIITYICNILLTPYALYRIWCKKSEFNQTEKYVQSAVCVIYLIVLASLII